MNPHVISTTLLVGHWLLAVGLSLRVITRRSPVGVSIAWIAVMFSVPFIGAGLYLLVGEKRLGRRRAARTAAHAGGMRHWQDSLRQKHVPVRQLAAEVQPLNRLAEGVIGFPALAGNSIELLDNFQRIFDAIVADIDGAREKCHLSFYIWHGAGRTVDVVDALVRAAHRGVECKALGDALGSKAFLKGELVDRLRNAGVHFRATLPTGLMPTLFSRADLRNHRKIVVIDDCIAYAGSQNLVDPRFFKQQSGAGEWVDAMARITGPAVAALGGVFALDWSIETGDEFAPPAVAGGGASTGCLIQVAPSGPGLQPEAIHQLMLTAIYASRNDLVMTTPYFVPDESILLALRSAAQRGVNVTLVVPARNNSILVRFASAANFDGLLSSGARIALFKGGLLHTKSLTIDGATSIFGSVNLDMRSFWLNFEISLFIYDPDFTGRLRSLQCKYLDNSEQLDLGSWRRRPKWRQLAEDAFRLLGPLL